MRREEALLLAEQRRTSLQADWDSLHDRKQRNRAGQFATPFSLAREITQLALSRIPRSQAIRFLEPAHGTGAFLSALLQQFAPSRLERAVGYEVDRQLARQVRPIWKCHGLILRAMDFTAQKAPPAGKRFHLLLANPPYVRHHHLTAATKQRLHSKVLRTSGIQLSGLCGLYAYFLLLAHEWLEEDAISAWLVPGEICDVNYGAALRAYLTTQVRLLRVHRFCAKTSQFNDALVSSAVIVYQNRAPDVDESVSITAGESLLEPQMQQRISIGELRKAGQWKLRSPKRRAPKRRLVPLEELFRVQRGLATGANAFFILPHHEARRAAIPEQVWTPILPGPKQLKHLQGDIIQADDGGWPILKPSLVLVNCTLGERELERRYPGLWRRFRRAALAGIADRYLCRHRHPWYRQEQRPPPPFLCTYMGRGSEGRAPFRFLWNQSRAVAANTYLLLYPQPSLAAALDCHAELAADLFRALQHSVLPALKDHGRIYGGGLHKLEPNELKKVLVPALFGL